ncbi:MAG: class I SAM-dependent methyltransferase [candidate division Zixibacteria bacterium]|nr:class I SAM-dependent methyltransferase [candidate division Zixibacteria bacterium]
MSKREFFNKQAVGWGEQYNQDDASQLRELVDRFDLEEGKTVLDVGCGTGILLTYLSEKVKEKGSVFALDFSWNMIFEAKKNRIHPTEEEKPQIHFINASVEALPLKDQRMDYITCLDTFAHVTDQKKAVYEMGRALKTGGQLFIAHSLGKKELAERHRLVGGVVEHDTLPDDDKMWEMMKNVGLKDIEITDQPNLYFASAKK